MDIEKMIEHLNDFNENHIAVLCGSGQCACGYLCDKDDCIVVRAATALSTLQAENEKLRETVDKYATAARAIALHLKPFCDESLPYDEMIADAARKASDELEQVKRELDAAVKNIPHECKTCVYHTVFFNGCTPDHDCTNPDGSCSNNYDRWQWRGPKED